jgi:hypothetical protein
MKIALHIDRLVLDGLPVNAAQGKTIGAAVERELTRLMASGGFDHGGARAIAKTNGPDIRMDRGDGPNATARKIAGAIHRSIGGAARPRDNGGQQT